MGNEELRVRVCVACNGQFSDAPCEPSECDILRVVENFAPESLRPKGRWEYYSTTMQECSVCKRHTARHRYEFCPRCGAKMEG